MFTEDQIKERLLQLGVQDSEIESVMHDVATVVMAKVSSGIIESLPIDERQKIETLSAEDVIEYLKQRHADAVIQLFPKLLEAAYTETWESYFVAMSQ